METIVSGQLCKQVVSGICNPEPNAANGLCPAKQILDPISDQIVSPLQSVIRRVEENVSFDIDVELFVTEEDVLVPGFSALRVITKNAHVLISHNFIRSFAFDKVFIPELRNRAALRNEHKLPELLVREEHIPNNIVPVILPRPRLFSNHLSHLLQFRTVVMFS